jgi:hypothetical protein
MDLMVPLVLLVQQAQMELTVPLAHKEPQASPVPLALL